MLFLQSQGIPLRILYPYCWWHLIHLAAGFYCQFPLTASQPGPFLFQALCSAQVTLLCPSLLTGTSLSFPALPSSHTAKANPPTCPSRYVPPPRVPPHHKAATLPSSASASLQTGTSTSWKAPTHIRDFQEFWPHVSHSVANVVERILYLFTKYLLSSSYSGGKHHAGC